MDRKGWSAQSSPAQRVCDVFPARQCEGPSEARSLQLQSASEQQVPSRQKCGLASAFWSNDPDDFGIRSPRYEGDVRKTERVSCPWQTDLCGVLQSVGCRFGSRRLAPFRAGLV